MSEKLQFLEERFTIPRRGWEVLKGYLQRGSNKGKITTLFPDSGSVVTKFELDSGNDWNPDPEDHREPPVFANHVFDLVTGPDPSKSRFYYLDGALPNYEALVNLLYLAAEHGWEIEARATGELTTTPSSYLAQVSYIVVHF